MPADNAATASRLLPNSHRWDTEVWRAIRALRNERSALVARIAYLDDRMERLVGRRATPDGEFGTPPSEKRDRTEPAAARSRRGA